MQQKHSKKAQLIFKDLVFSVGCSEKAADVLWE
jgi:hypothetical protein